MPGRGQAIVLSGFVRTIGTISIASPALASVDLTNGNDILLAPAGGSTITVVSSSAVDDSDLTIVMQGPGIDGKDKIVEQVMDGTTPVVGTEGFLYINRAWVKATDNLLNFINQGDITATWTTGGQSCFFMPTQHALSIGCNFVVPIPDAKTNIQYHLGRIEATVEKATGSAVQVATNYQAITDFPNAGNPVRSPGILPLWHVTPTVKLDQQFSPPLYLQPGSFIKLSIVGNDANGGDINGTMHLMRSGGVAPLIPGSI